jgi:hypothetical protein
MSRPDPSGPRLRAEAFGISFDLYDDLDVPGLAARPDGTGATITRIWHDRDHVATRWSGAAAKRTREMVDGEKVLLSVDYDATRGYLLHAPGIGSVLVSADGLDVVAAPEPDTTDWGMLLIGQVLPLVSTIRGHEVFHAAGVALDDRAWMLCAASGTGKTSIAAHLVLQGAGLLSDDVIAVDDDLVAHPGVSVLHVRTPELARLSTQSLSGLRRVGTVGGRATFVAESPAVAHPLGAVYLLERARAGPPIERVERPSPFSLLGATFNLSVQTKVRLVHQMEMCAQLVEHIPVYRVRILPDSSAANLAVALSSHILTSQGAPA